MTGGRFLAVMSLLALWVTVTASVSYNDAVQLYDKGRYLEAASLAEKADTASGFALAARALLAHAIYVAGPASRADGVQKGVTMAKKALALDPTNVEAHLQLVVALHQETRETSPVSAFFQGLADEAHSHLVAAIKLEPDNPWAYSLLGGWNFEVVRLAGATLAEQLLGATLKNGRAAFDRSLQLQPRSIMLQYYFARSLLLSDPDANRAQAVAALHAALDITPTNHLEKLLAARVRTVLNATKSDSSKELVQALDSDGF